MEWISLTEDPTDEVRSMVAAFASTVPGGERPTKWLRENALEATPEVRTRLAIEGNRIVGFYAMSAGDVLLTKEQANQMECHLRASTAVIRYLCKTSDGPSIEVIVVDAMAETLCSAEHLGITLVAVDVYNSRAAKPWKERVAFHLGDRENGPKNPYRFFMQLRS